MKRMLCFVIMVLVATLAPAQDPFNKQTFDPAGMDLLTGETSQKETRVTSVLMLKGYPIIKALAQFPEEDQLAVATLLAEFQGIYVIQLKNGCRVYAEDQGTLDRHVQFAKAYEECSDVTCRHLPRMPGPICNTQCDSDNKLIECSKGELACCGCIRPSGPAGSSRGCGECRWSVPA